MDELRRLWDVADSPIEKAVVGLLGINAMRVDEVADANVADLDTVDGMSVLHIKPRTSVNVRPYTVLSVQLREQIDLAVAGRRPGPLLVAADGARLDRRRILRITSRLGRKAGIPFPVTPMTLTFTLRAIAIDRGFSYVGVVARRASWKVVASCGG